MQMKMELVTNAIAVSLARSNGQLGLAAFVLGGAAYQNLAGVAWQAPPQPDASPVIPNGATGPAITRITATLERDMVEWNTFNNVEAALKRLIIAAIDNAYISSLRHPPH